MLDFDFFPQFFSTKPRDRLGRTSPKWPILCRVGRKTTTQSSRQINVTAISHERFQQFDKTDREYSVDATDDLVWFWRSKVKVTAVRKDGKDMHIDAGVSEFIFRLGL